MDTDKLAEQIAKRILQETPRTVGLMDARRCAAFLDESYSHFMSYTQHLDDFPKGIRIHGKGRRKWEAGEVLKFARKYKER